MTVFRDTVLTAIAGFEKAIFVAAVTIYVIAIVASIFSEVMAVSTDLIASVSS